MGLNNKIKVSGDDQVFLRNLRPLKLPQFPCATFLLEIGLQHSLLLTKMFQPLQVLLSYLRVIRLSFASKIRVPLCHSILRQLISMFLLQKQETACTGNRCGATLFCRCGHPAADPQAVFIFNESFGFSTTYKKCCVPSKANSSAKKFKPWTSPTREGSLSLHLQNLGHFYRGVCWKRWVNYNHI